MAFEIIATVLMIGFIVLFVIGHVELFYALLLHQPDTTDQQREQRAGSLADRPHALT